MAKHRNMNRRDFLRKGAAAAVAAPLFINSKVFGANERFTLAGIGMGGRGRGVLGAALGFSELQVVAVCDVVTSHCKMAKDKVDKHYGNTDCSTYKDFRDIVARDDIDADACSIRQLKYKRDS